MKKILIVAPHMDDETLGCGGTILRHTEEGDQVHCVLISKMKVNKKWDASYIKKKTKELEKVKKVFKFKTFSNFNYEPGEFDKENIKEIVEDLNNLFLKLKPDFIYCPFVNDVHSDHQITTKAVMSASKWFKLKSIKKIFMYETLSETNFNFVNDRVFRPNYFIDISKFIKKKLKICSIYRTEIHNHPFPRSETSVKALADLRGSQSGFKSAEAFELVFGKK